MKSKIRTSHLAPLRLLPCAADKCQECAVKHDVSDPHNQQSLHYQYHFYAEHGRWPTWHDAMAHCTEKIKQYWLEELARMGALPASEGKKEARGKKP
jgi:hypothetical protein